MEVVSQKMEASMPAKRKESRNKCQSQWMNHLNTVCVKDLSQNQLFPEIMESAIDKVSFAHEIETDAFSITPKNAKKVSFKRETRG